MVTGNWRGCEGGFGQKVGANVHFHAVDDGEEIVALQPAQMHGFAQGTCDRMLWTAGVEQRDLAASVG